MKNPILAVLLAVSSALAVAQEYPSRPIRMVVPYNPGGSVDQLARVVGNALTPRLGQRVIVENRAGGGGTIGTAAVASAAPDGYTLLITDGAPITHAHLLAKVPYDPAKDLAPLVKAAVGPSTLLVASNSPFRSLPELIKYARANPGKVSWGTPGTGTSAHVGFEVFKEKLGLDIVHVPYKGGGGALISDVVGGQISIGNMGLTAAIGNLKAGKLRLLAVWGSSRIDMFPDAPTVREATGDPGLEGLLIWYGFLLPQGVPPRVAARLESEITASLKEPGVASKIVANGLSVVAEPSAVFGESNRAQTATYAAIFKRLDLLAK